VRVSYRGCISGTVQNWNSSNFLHIAKIHKASDSISTITGLFACVLLFVLSAVFSLFHLISRKITALVYTPKNRKIGFDYVREVVTYLHNNFAGGELYGLVGSVRNRLFLGFLRLYHIAVDRLRVLVSQGQRLQSLADGGIFLADACGNLLAILLGARRADCFTLKP